MPPRVLIHGGAPDVAAHDGHNRVPRGVLDNALAEPVVLQRVEPATCKVKGPTDPMRTFFVMLFDAQRRPLAALSFGDKVMAKTVVGVFALPPGEPVHIALLMGDVLLASNRLLRARQS